MAKEGERVVMIAMDGSSYCNYAFDCKYCNLRYVKIDGIFIFTNMYVLLWDNIFQKMNGQLTRN